ncbi:MAG: hypothetical protein BRD51_05160 [Bacteroidetes bacterium SW_11_64_17]|nr:MAG: hypothetical protein BRD51_05160 [Bacteroidetes bacterium SW_11_64_17]
MGHRRTDDGDFQSDKHPELPENVFALHMDDDMARDLIYQYARRTDEVELREGLLAALENTEPEGAEQ